MTTSEIVRLLHAKRAGNNKWQAHCPVTRNHSHNDRNPSLSIGVGNKPGFTVLKCQAGCDVHDIVDALGWRMRDLCGDGQITPAMRQYQSDHERLEILETRLGCFMWLQVVEPGKRNYWAAAERNTAVEIKEMRRIIYPVEAYWERRNEIAQHLIKEYGFDKLMQCADPGYPDCPGPHNKGISFWKTCRRAGGFRYVFSGFPLSIGKFAGEREEPIYEVTHAH